MKHHTIYLEKTGHSLPMTPALRDGLIILAGLFITIGSFFNNELAMWWLGA